MTNLISKIFKNIISDSVKIFEFFICFFPESRSGMFLRTKYWNIKLKNTGGVFEFGSQIMGAERLICGHNFSLGRNAFLKIHLEHTVYIGNNVSIAHNSYISSANHLFDLVDIPIMQQGYDDKKVLYNDKSYNIVIEDDVWVASNCTLLAGVHLQKGCIVAAGTIVISGIYPEYSIIAGNPAKVLKNRLSPLPTDLNILQR